MTSAWRNICPNNCEVPEWAVFTAIGVAFLMLLTIVIFSICLCRVYKKLKKLKLSQGVSENAFEADMHYAELQNLPASSRGQCNGRTSPDVQPVQNSDYATVAVLKEVPSEDNSGNCQQTEDSRVEDGMRENQILVEAE